MGKSAITCICFVDETVWVGSQGGYLHVFNSTSHQLLLSKQISDHFLISITSIIHAFDQQLVIIILSDGKIIAYKDVLKTPTRTHSLRRNRKDGSTSSDKSSSQDSQDIDANLSARSPSPIYGSWPHHINFKVGNITNNVNRAKANGKLPAFTLIECGTVNLDIATYCNIYVHYHDESVNEIWCGLAGGRLIVIEQTTLRIKCKLSIRQFTGNVIGLATNRTRYNNSIGNRAKTPPEDAIVWAIGEDSCSIYSWSAMNKQALQHFDLSESDTERSISSGK